jgi:hypothetical protein
LAHATARGYPSLVHLRSWRSSLVLLLLVLLSLAVGCSKHRLSLPVVENQRPTLRLTQAPASSTRPYFYAYELYWTAFDPDGRVDRYLYCLDPPTAAGADTPWTVSRENRLTLQLHSDDVDSLGTKANPGGFHVFALKAVDERGLASATAVAAFFSYTVAPTVEFVQPRANHLLSPMLPPTTTFTFTGTDPDGQRTRRPLYYRYHLFIDGNPDFDFLTMLIRPDSLRHYYAPHFAEWDSISGDTCRVQVSNMVPDRKYVLAVVAFDEAGAYSPVFSYDGNLLYFFCQYTGRQGPRMTVWNEFFNYTYLNGSYITDPVAYLHAEVPCAQPLSFHWSAAPQSGAALKSFRWALDIERLDDETPRTNETTDWSHWSQATAITTWATVGPFAGGGTDSLDQHLFYIEAQDDNGLKSLATIQFNVIRPNYRKDLLFVDDERFSPDQASRARPDSVLTPGGLWPSAAELDTFFFARGGVRWRYYQPPTQLSPPGIFLGYDFDTIGTRTMRDGLVPLSLLANYRHVVWYSDPATAATAPPYYPNQPMPTLRWICGPGQTNTLALYSRIGGSTWMMGGGIAYNSLVPFNSVANDGGGSMVFSGTYGELVPGRLLHGTAHWQSEITIKQPGRAEKNPNLAPAWPGAPDYLALPEQLMERTPETDPVPPERGPGTYYSALYTGEVLTQPNSILENVSPDPDQPEMVSMLDTLYFAAGGNVGPGLPVMTYYHGSGSGPVLFSGFPLWHFQRAQILALADFVLQNMWGLQRKPLPR